MKGIGRTLVYLLTCPSYAKNKKTETKKSLAALSEDGVKYAVDKNTWVVYDFASYELAKAKRGQLVAIGKYDAVKKKIIFS